MGQLKSNGFIQIKVEWLTIIVESERYKVKIQLIVQLSVFDLTDVNTVLIHNQGKI